MLIIAHRLSTIRGCDRIYVMDDGRITECGTHDELLESDGLYSEMWMSQIGEQKSCSTVDDNRDDDKKEEDVMQYE